MKILEIDNKPTIHKQDSFGDIYLYPEGTIRKIRKLTLRGYKIIYEKASIKFDSNLDTSIYFNDWTTINKK